MVLTGLMRASASIEKGECRYGIGLARRSGGWGCVTCRFWGCSSSKVGSSLFVSLFVVIVMVGGELYLDSGHSMYSET